MKKIFALVLTLALAVMSFTALAEIDRAGNEFTLPESVDTVVSMAPSITQTLIDLGCADKIVAIDKNSVGLEGLPEGLPAFDMMTPDVEQLAVLAPDMVLYSGISMVGGENPFQPLVDMGVSFAAIPSSATIEDIYTDITFIGDVMGAEEAAVKVNDTLRAELDEIKALGDSIPEEERKSVYFEISAAPYCYSFGSNVYMDEMISLVGAENALADQEGWIGVDPETVVASNPDVILTNVNYIENPIDEILGRDGWADVTAVKDNAVYYIDNMSSSLPNEHITLALWQMGEALYPDVFKK